MFDSMRPDTISVDLQPIGRRAEVAVGTTILAAAQSSGVELMAICGGLGVCESCRIRVVSGPVNSPTEVEEDLFSDQELATGYRLACQTEALGPVRVDVPADSLSATQRLQTEGIQGNIALDPSVVAVPLVLEPPTLEDLRDDATRLSDALADAGYVAIQLPLPVLASASGVLREQHWVAQAAVQRQPSPDRGSRLCALLPSGAPIFGLAVDVGTTKVAAYLVDIGTGTTVARVGAMNPQIAYGEDVVSRITYANVGADAYAVLHERLIECLNLMVDDLCVQAGVSRSRIVDAVVVGNTAMHHLFAGLPVRQLGEAPYVAAIGPHMDLQASEVGLRLAPGATLYLPPNIAGYVGADHVSMLLAAGLDAAEQTTLALDIGTNTEISLAHSGAIWSCSCASGPAFEGAHIRDGMRATAGAIERVRYLNGEFLVRTIDDAAPVGICGSGILDAVAEGLRAEIIDSRGALSRTHPLVIRSSSGPACLLVPALKTGHDRDVLLTRSDVNEIQLAKGAIRAGTDLLLAAAGLQAGDVARIVVAGAFGTYLDIGSAVRIGMLPDLPRERFAQVGNAAGSGAQQLLISRERRAAARELARRVQYIELTAHAAFTETFVQALSFDGA